MRCLRICSRVIKSVGTARINSNKLLFEKEFTDEAGGEGVEGGVFEDHRPGRAAELFQKSGRKRQRALKLFRERGGRKFVVEEAGPAVLYEAFHIGRPPGYYRLAERP